MKYSKILILAFLVVCNSCSAQKLNKYELESRNKASLISKKVIKDTDTPYLLFSISNTFYLLISKKESDVNEIIVELKGDEINIVSSNKIKKPNKILLKSFDKSNYHSDFIGFESDYFKEGYEEAKGNMFYFVMRDSNGSKYGETCLSLIVKPNPLDKALVSYMTSKLINY